MIKKDIIINALVVTATLVICVMIVILLSSCLNVIKYSKNEFYDFGDDKIPSIYKVLGKRNLYFYKYNNNNEKTIKVYKYKNITDVKSDLSNYIIELKKNYYTNTSDYDLNDDKGTIQLTGSSVDENKIIIVDIEYSKEWYSIKITKGIGTINYY